MDLDVPETAAGMIRRKLDALDRRIDALCGTLPSKERNFTSVVVAALLGADELDLEEKLDRLCRVYHLVHAVGEEELPDGTLPRDIVSPMSFTKVPLHGCARETSCSSAPPGRRGASKRHADQAPRIAAQLAMHFERGADFGRAVQYLAHAGDNATALYGYAEAEGYYSHALGLIERPSLEERSFSNSEPLPQTRAGAFALSRFDDAVDDLTKMMQRARLAESPALECNALNALSHVLFFTHRLDEMGVRAGEALHAAKGSGNEALRALSLTFIARRHISLGDLGEGQADARGKYPHRLDSR